MSKEINKMLYVPRIFVVWIIVYYFAGIVSSHFDDSTLGISIIWFPTGVATAVFMVSPWKQWPYLICMFIALNLLIDPPVAGEFLKEMGYSIMALPLPVLIAWVVRKYSRRGDDLNVINVWFFSTLLLSLLDTALSILIFHLVGKPNAMDIFWPGYISDISGVFFATTILMGFINIRLSSLMTSRNKLIAGVIIWLISIVITIWVFGGYAGKFFVNAGIAHADLLKFMLVGIPIICCAIMALVLGNWGGSLALLTLGTLVIICFNLGKGPLFLKGFSYCDSVLLVQIYLTASALFLVFLRVITRSVTNLDSQQRFSSRKHVIYQVNLATGNITWGEIPAEFTDLELLSSTNKKTLLQHIFTKDREAFSEHWSQSAVSNIITEIPFRMKTVNDEWLWIMDHRSLVMNSHGQVVVLGSWTFIK